MKKTIAILLIPISLRTNLFESTYSRPTPTEETKILTKAELLEIEYQAYLVEQEKIRAEQEKIKLEEEEKKRIAEIERKNSVGCDFNNLTRPSNLKAEELYSLLSDTKLRDLSWTIIQCEKDYNVNAILLTSLIALESGWGTSDRANYQNNLSGFAVYNDNSKGTYFASKEQCVIATAKMLQKDYLREDGVYFNGYGLDDVNIKYSADKKWATKINAIAQKLSTKYSTELNK